ncbi:hypothetical protein VB774_20135 [Pseudanabaena galeata UHCC 0370]|uniref:Uncharacterized protein n=1 Tax=Pseudanabaena galeata UHCC 0370 TaxID=3110310 RepID=A0ABU5TPP4_9CYAN|nr:hypothetical protein [Pseudanabaena galeata]MEA5479943.1 hypothetical protein [Pseudanabaena galeata UHCC 0370]
MIRIWEQPLANFLEFTGMLPFAILVNTDNRERLLQDIAQKIDQIPVVIVLRLLTHKFGTFSKAAYKDCAATDSAFGESCGGDFGF